MTYALALLAFFAMLALIYVIILLLRQLNKEREERYALLNHYGNLAMRVRWAQAMTEEPALEAMGGTMWPEETFPSSVSNVEGVE